MLMHIPSCRLHKPSGQAVTTLNGKDVCLGRQNTPASQQEYQRVIAEFLANGGHPTAVVSDLTISYVILIYIYY
jgi:hypothetical protein